MLGIHTCASAYLDGADHPVSAEELAALRRFISVQFKGIRCPIVYIQNDIALPECIQSLQTEGVLHISTANNHHPCLTPAENAQFRAVHDWHHILIGADSTFSGECATFKHAAMVAPPEIRWILFSEIALQAAACLVTGEFQPQKLVKTGGF